MACCRPTEDVIIGDISLVYYLLNIKYCHPQLFTFKLFSFRKIIEQDISLDYKQMIGTFDYPRFPCRGVGMNYKRLNNINNTIAVH